MRSHRRRTRCGGSAWWGLSGNFSDFFFLYILVLFMDPAADGVVTTALEASREEKRCRPLAARPASPQPGQAAPLRDRPAAAVPFARSLVVS